MPLRNKFTATKGTLPTYSPIPKDSAVELKNPQLQENRTKNTDIPPGVYLVQKLCGGLCQDVSGLKAFENKFVLATYWGKQTAKGEIDWRFYCGPRGPGSYRPGRDAMPSEESPAATAMQFWIPVTKRMAALLTERGWSKGPSFWVFNGSIERFLPNGDKYTDHVWDPIGWAENLPTLDPDHSHHGQYASYRASQSSPLFEWTSFITDYICKHDEEGAGGGADGDADKTEGMEEEVVSGSGH